MNPTTFSKIRALFEPELEVLGPGHELSPAVLQTLYSLLQVLADDVEIPRAHFESYLQRRSKLEFARMREYESGARFVDDAARRMAGKPLADCTLAERDRVLSSLLRRFRNPELQHMLLRRLRLTSYNADFLISRPEYRRFRKFVVSDLLSYYYTTERGWAVVDYNEFPGFVRYEREACEVRSIRIEGPYVWLELSDACYERLSPATLRMDAEGRFTCKTKGGRQRATFSRSAQQAMGDLIEENERGMCLRVGDAVTQLELES